MFNVLMFCIMEGTRMTSSVFFLNRRKFDLFWTSSFKLKVKDSDIDPDVTYMKAGPNAGNTGPEARPGSRLDWGVRLSPGEALGQNQRSDDKGKGKGKGKGNGRGGGPKKTDKGKGKGGNGKPPVKGKAKGKGNDL